MALLRHARYIVYFVLLFVLLQGLASSSEKWMPPTIANPTSVSAFHPASFTIMTFNIHHGEGLDGKVNIERIADLIRNEKADVIALQEVDRFRFRSGFVDQAKVLAEQLRMDMRFAPSLTYSMGQYGNAILSRYPIEDSSFTLLPGTKETRSLLTVQINPGSGPVRIATSHLGLSKKDRSVQLARISDMLSIQDTPLIVAGDFNMEIDAFQFKIATSMLTNMPLRADVKSTFLDEKTIDHIFMNTKNVQSSWMIPTIFSDHYPVMTLIPLGSPVQV